MGYLCMWLMLIIFFKSANLLSFFFLVEFFLLRVGIPGSDWGVSYDRTFNIVNRIVDAIGKIHTVLPLNLRLYCQN